MKKVFSKIKKVFGMIGFYLLWIGTKVLGVNEISRVQSIQSLYGIAPPKEPVSKINKIMIIIRTYIIPIAFVIGTIVYFRKSQSSTKRKIITTIIVLAIVILVCWAINYIIQK